MKALILAGGRGKRLEELSEQQNKCMYEIAGRPVICNTLDVAVNAQVDEVVIVVGYRAEDIINYFGTSYRGKQIKYVIQREQLGLVHAISCAKTILNGDDFMLLLGDEILVEPRHELMLERFHSSPEIFGVCGVVNVSDRDLIKRTYSIIQNDQRQIFRLVEKPKVPFNDIMGTGDCVFRNALFDYIELTPIHHERKERELPDLIQCAVDDGRLVESFDVCKQYGNVNTKSDIELVNSFLSSK
jgi:dTDP-glucose pyrophosphorylase